MTTKGKKARRNARRHEQDFLQRQAVKIERSKKLLVEAIQVIIDRGVFEDIRNDILAISRKMGELSKTKKKVVCPCCHGVKWEVTNKWSVFRVVVPRKLPCYVCGDTGTIEVLDPDNLIQPVPEVRR